MDPVEEFIRAATGGRQARAEAILAASPEIASDPWVRLVHGEGWDGDASERGGPLGWAPLLYVTHSVFASTSLARELLERGADPNVTFTNEYGEMSALYGAAGVVHDPELTRLLLEAGANPDDGESVYHSTEARSPECLRALLEHGATVEPIMLAHALDDERPEHVRLLLEAGADAARAAPVRRPARPRSRVPAAPGRARRGARAPKRRGLAPPDAPPHRLPARGPARRGRLRRAARFAGRGYDVDEDDLAIAAIVRGERPDAVPEALDYDQQEVVILAALRGVMPLVIELLGPDFRGVVGGSPEGSLLQHAAWVGNPELIALLLEAGAERPARSTGPRTARSTTPIAGRDYAGVAARLVEAGAVIEPAHLEQADGPLAEWLQARRPR